MFFVKKITWWRLQGSNDISEYISKCSEWFYSIEIKKYWTRSNAQNRYLRGVVYGTIVKETGNNPEELHYFFKHKFIDTPDKFPSTKELNKDEFVEYVEKIKDFMAEQWIIIPDANDFS